MSSFQAALGDFSVTDDLLLKLADIKSDGNILPPPTMTVERRNLKGHEWVIATLRRAAR